MKPFSRLLVERDVATQDDVEASMANQVLHGGHIGTNLVELGKLDEMTLQRLLSEYLELPVGPAGQLADVTSDLEALLSKVVGRRHRVYPVERTDRALQVAVARALHPEAQAEIRSSVGLELELVVVTPLRMTEALSRWCDVPMSRRQRWQLELIESGRIPQRSGADGRDRALAVFPIAATYRRMSEDANGVVTSDHEYFPPGAAPGTGDSSAPPATLDGTGFVDTGKSAPMPAEHAQPSLDGDKPGRTTEPYVDGDDGEQTGKRDTQPWRDANKEEPPPLSIGSLNRSLSEAPVSDEAKIHEEHRRLRHRGPFTREQATDAVSEAVDVHLVMEILVRYARQFFERCVLFVVSNDEAELRLAHGVGMELANLRVGLEGASVLRGAYHSGDPVVSELSQEGVDATLREALHVRGDARVTVIPLSIRGRVVTLFYGDDREEGVARSAVTAVTDFTKTCAAKIQELILERKRAGR